MPRVGVPSFTDTVTASPAGATETVIATLNGCTVRYPSDHFILHAFANITLEAAVTAVVLTIRRGGVAGAVVTATTVTPKAAADFVGITVGLDGSDAPGDVANLTYVLTATLTSAAGASTVNDVALVATLTQQSVLLTIATAVIAPGEQQFTFTVPGHQRWYPRSVFATASRDTGGAPDRRYLLTITNGTNTVANIGAEDAGTEPGTCDVTWAQCPSANVAALSVGVSVAPLALMPLPPGYVIVGSIIAGAPADEWSSALCWYDFVYTTPPGVFQAPVVPLYVIRVPDPAPGDDWFSVVPGQYLYDVTGITATLTTSAGGDQPTDISGNGNDGDYVPAAVASDFYAGAVTGDDALNMGVVVAPFRTIGWQMGATPTPLVGDCSMIFWRLMNFGEPGVETFTAFDAADMPVCSIVVNAGGGISWSTNGVEVQATTDFNVFPRNGTWHLIGYSYDSGTQRVTIYMDGVAIPLVIDVAGLPTRGVVAYSYFGLNTGGTPVAHGGVDEFACFDSTLSAADHAAIFAARGDSATYEGTVLARNPLTYYRLDGAPQPAGGRQVALDITNGDTTVMRIPTGFPVAPVGGPFLYSWQPKLLASAQTSDGIVTTVAVPPLILPAGYTIESRTLVGSLSDQWSDITIWWDSSLMDAIYGPGAYDFPPAIRLVYHQDPNAPIIDF